MKSLLLDHATLYMLQGAGRSPRLRDPPPSMLAATNLSAPAGPFARLPEDELEGATALERQHFLAAMRDAEGCSQDS
jgi:hypothetical protein